MSNTMFETYIVPWALPGEEIPFHVTWPKLMQFDGIRVTLPYDFQIEDILNVDKGRIDIKDNIVTIYEVLTSRFLDIPNYFGMVVSSRRDYEQLKISKKISIEFLRNNEVVNTLELYARIFRPCLEVVELPKKIVISAEARSQSIPLHLRYVGFGDIRLQIKGSIGGKVISHGDSIFYELLRRLSLLSDPERRDEERERLKKHQYELDQEETWKLTETIKKKVELGTIPPEEVDEDIVKEMRQWLIDLSTQEDFMEILYAHVEDVMMSLLVDLLDRNPVDNVQLVNARTKLRTRIKAPPTNIRLLLKYKDLIGNEYVASLEIPLEIEDEEILEQGVDLELAINVEKWDNKPFLDVTTMDINK